MALGSSDFNLRGSDLFHKADSFDDNIYIAHLALNRYVSLKAFVNSISIECTKEVEKNEEKNKNHTIISEYGGTFNYDVKIDMPAATVAESRNNLAKIEELQKLISRYSLSQYGNGTYRAISNKNGTALPIFKVWFRNLISAGRYYKDYPSDSVVEFKDIDYHGLACYIDSISYEPDFDMGFFEDDRFLFPKNISLSLKLVYDGDGDANRKGINGVAINGFKANGAFSGDDFGAAPFGVIATEENIGYTSEALNNRRLYGESPEFTTKTMNKVDTVVEGGIEDTYLFISLINTSSISRYVKLKGYIESHSRDYAVNILYAESKNRNVGSVIRNSGQPVSFKHLINKMKVSMPSKDITEAKKNCAKMQYLLRMFYKAHSDAESISSKIKEIKGVEKKLQDSGSEKIAKKNRVIRHKGRQDLLDMISRTVVVFSPSFIEAPNASYNIPAEFEAMYSARIAMNITNLSLDIDLDQGFFRDDVGRIFPKSMSVSLEFQYVKDDLVKNYKYNEGKEEYDYMGLGNTKHPYYGKAAFYPFNRKTVKTIGD